MDSNKHNKFGGMNMKRKLVYLPNEYSKDVVDNINGYFDRGYEIEDVFNANDGIYIILALKGNENYKYAIPDLKSNLIEEKKVLPDESWCRTSTKDVGNTQVS
jgi:hypothetical protein